MWHLTVHKFRSHQSRVLGSFLNSVLNYWQFLRIHGGWETIKGWKGSKITQISKATWKNLVIYVISQWMGKIEVYGKLETNHPHPFPFVCWLVFWLGFFLLFFFHLVGGFLFCRLISLRLFMLLLPSLFCRKGLLGGGLSNTCSWNMCIFSWVARLKFFK